MTRTSLVSSFSRFNDGVGSTTFPCKSNSSPSIFLLPVYAVKQQRDQKYSREHKNATEGKHAQHTHTENVRHLGSVWSYRRRRNSRLFHTALFKVREGKEGGKETPHRYFTLRSALFAAPHLSFHGVHFPPSPLLAGLPKQMAPR